jgi:hypothetical protein
MRLISDSRIWLTLPLKLALIESKKPVTMSYTTSPIASSLLNPLILKYKFLILVDDASVAECLAPFTSACVPAGRF